MVHHQQEILTKSSEKKIALSKQQLKEKLFGLTFILLGKLLNYTKVELNFHAL